MLKLINNNIDVEKMIKEIPSYRIEVMIDLYKSVNCNSLARNPAKRRSTINKISKEVLNDFRKYIKDTFDLECAIENEKIRTVLPCSLLLTLNDCLSVYSIYIIEDDIVEFYISDVFRHSRYFLISSLSYYYVEGDEFADVSNTKTYIKANSSIDAFNKFFYMTYIYNPMISISSEDFKKTLRYNVIKSIEIDLQLSTREHPSYFTIDNPFKSKLVEPPINLFRFAYLYEMQYPNLSYDYQSVERINPRYIDGNKEMLGEFYKVASSKLYKKYLRLNRSKLFVY